MAVDSRTLDLARQFVGAAQRSVGPVDEAGILPAQAYTCEHLWAFERDEIFAREWLCVGHVNEVPNAGDHLPLTVLDEPLLLVRGEAGEVRVLSGVCQHRGHPLVGGLTERDADAQCLNAPRLVCPYHNWSYALDGALVGAPDMRQTCPLPELRARIRLPEIRSEIFHGLIFINFDPEAEPLGPSVAKLDAELATLPLAELVPTLKHVQHDLAWNWKLHHENALEPYHTSYVHRDVHDAVPASMTSFLPHADNDRDIMRRTGFESGDSGDLFEATGSRRLPDIDGLTEEQARRVTFVSVMPNLVAVIQPSVVSMTIINPTSAGTVDTRRINLYPPAAVASPHFDAIAAEQLDRIKTIVEQDQTTQMALQKAYRSRFAPRGTLAWLEAALPQLNAWVVRAYERAIARLDA